MRKIILAIIIFILAFLNSYSQFNYSFKKIIKINGYECAVKGLKQTNDLGYVICGYYGYLANNSTVDGGFLLKLNKAGQLMWYKKFDSQNNYGFYELSIDSSENIYAIAKGKSNSDTTHSDIIIVKTDSLGNQIWEKSLGDINNDDGAFSLDIHENNLFIGGFSQPNGTGITKAYILKVDSAGNVLWNRTIEDINHIQPIFTKKILSDRIITIGTADNGKTFIVVLSSSGTILYSKKANFSNLVFFSSADSFENDGIIISGATSSFAGASNLNPILIALDSDYNLKWAKKYNLPGTNISEFININKTSDGNYIATYEPENINGKNHLFGLVKLDTNGVQIWGRLYSQTSEVFPYKLIETKDSGFVVTGYIKGDSPYTKNIYILKTDKNGLTDNCENDSTISLNYQNILPTFTSFGLIDSIGVSSNTSFSIIDSFRLDSLFCLDSSLAPIMSLPINTTENNFVIYPNPTNDILNIELTTNNNQEYSIEVRDITGKLIKNEKTERNSKLTRLDLTQNNKGVYVVVIRNKDWIKSKIVIKM